MQDGIQIYNCNNDAVFQQSFFNMTRLNFTYKGRRMFRREKNKLVYNTFFPFNQVKKELRFEGIYLSAYSIEDFREIDSDFDIGFNNIEYNFEEKFIQRIMSDFEVFLLMNMPKSCDAEKIVQDIEKRGCMIMNLKNNSLIIKLDCIGTFYYLEKYVQGIFGGIKNKKELSEEYLYNLLDLNDIQKLMEMVEIISIRVPIFANYNLMLCSDKQEKIDMVKSIIFELEDNNFQVEEIRGIDSPRNFLLR